MQWRFEQTLSCTYDKTQLKHSDLYALRFIDIAEFIFHDLNFLRFITIQFLINFWWCLSSDDVSVILL